MYSGMNYFLFLLYIFLFRIIGPETYDACYLYVKARFAAANDADPERVRNNIYNVDNLNSLLLSFCIWPIFDAKWIEYLLNLIQVFTHATCATDTNQVQLILQSCIEILIEQNLKSISVT